MKKIIVDGNKIRNNLDIECPPVAKRQADPTCFNVRIYIPDDEVWIDHSFLDECEEMLTWENELENFVGEQYLQKRSQKVKQLEEKRNKEIISTEHYCIKSEKKDGLSCIFVKGDVVRKFFDPDFIFGGHHYVYSYIPQHEIWLDNKTDPKEIPFVYLHEKLERDLMKEGKSYEEGHEVALCYEKIERRKNGAVYPGDEGYFQPKTNLTEYFKFR